jgi:hypothetical protein
LVGQPHYKQLREPFIDFQTGQAPGRIDKRHRSSAKAGPISRTSVPRLTFFIAQGSFAFTALRHNNELHSHRCASFIVRRRDASFGQVAPQRVRSPYPLLPVGIAP